MSIEKHIPNTNNDKIKLILAFILISSRVVFNDAAQKGLLLLLGAGGSSISLTGLGLGFGMAG